LYIVRKLASSIEDAVMLAQSTTDMATIDTRLHPLQALRAVRRLIADPEDTKQVFVILTAMRGRSGLRIFDRFRRSATGAAVLSERRSLLGALQDSEALARLTPGSLGRAYLEFMKEEDLSAEGLVAPSQVWGSENLTPDMLLFRERLRDMHDLNHVMTGYGRDKLGELCLLAFMYAHTRNLGMSMIVLMGMARVSRGPHGGRARRAVVQAWLHGRKARWMPEQDWENMLAQPLELSRFQTRIEPPTRYAALMA
jgi:ubiquinone biosynthesis protein COQ4